jgi:DNA-binding protein H-NS
MPRKTTLESIRAKIRELEAKAKELKRIEKPGIKELRAVIVKYKLKPADIMAALKLGGVNRKGMAKGTRLKPKYRNPMNKGETWAGRGLKPKWIAAALRNGKKLEDFAI